MGGLFVNRGPVRLVAKVHPHDIAVLSPRSGANLWKQAVTRGTWVAAAEGYECAPRVLHARWKVSPVTRRKETEEPRFGQRFGVPRARASTSNDNQKKVSIAALAARSAR